MRTSDFTIEKIDDLRELSDAQIDEITSYEQILQTEAHPEDPLTPLDHVRLRIRTMPSYVIGRVAVARGPDGDIAGLGEAWSWDPDTNQHLMFGGVNVRPDLRRRGLGTALLAAVTGILEAEGRRLLMGGTSTRVPAGEAFASALGAEACYHDHTNRLLVEEVDREMLSRWAAEGPVKGAGYTVLTLDGPWPEEMLPEICRCVELMNTAPRENMQMEDWKNTPERQLEDDQNMVKRGTERWSLFMRHDASGELIGFTEVWWNPRSLPATVSQGGTVVRPDHRGHGLAKWMKGAMLLRVLDERPGIVDVRTNNANSNDAMLAINNAMGFKPYISNTNWQIPVEGLRAYLSSKPA